MSEQWLMCTNFKIRMRALATGNFRPKLVALPGGLAPPQRPPPPPTAPQCQGAVSPLHATGIPSPPPAQNSQCNHEVEQNPHPNLNM